MTKQKKSSLSKLKLDRLPKYKFNEHELQTSLGRFIVRFVSSNRIFTLIEREEDDMLDLYKWRSRGNYIINLVSAMEVYFKEAIVQYEKRWTNERGYEELLRETITLNDAYSVFSTRSVSRAQLVSHFYSFQRIEGIDFVFSRLLGVKFLNELEKKSYSHAGHSDINVSKFGDWRKLLVRLLSTRHILIHEFPAALPVEIEEVVLLDDLVYDFISCCDHYFTE